MEETQKIDATVETMDNIAGVTAAAVEEVAQEQHRSTGPLSETDWVAVAFVIFAIIFIKKVLPFILSSLDSRSEQIANELQEANDLKNEAQRLLAEAERKSADAETGAKEMIETAKSEAKRIAQTAEANMNEEADRKFALVQQKIKRAEQQAIENVKKEAVEEATRIATQILSEKTAKTHKLLLSESIAKITSSIN